MQLWNELDKSTQNYIKIIAIVISLIIILFCWVNIYILNNKLDNNIVINRGSIRDVRLISAEKKKDGYYVSIVDGATAKAYDDVYVTKDCPNFRVDEGATMQVSVILKENYKTKEKTIELGRVYDYICTKKNMVAIDKDFMENLIEADKDFIENNSIQRAK